MLFGFRKCHSCQGPIFDLTQQVPLGLTTTYAYGHGESGLRPAALSVVDHGGKKCQRELVDRNRVASASATWRGEEGNRDCSGGDRLLPGLTSTASRRRTPRRPGRARAELIGVNHGHEGVVEKLAPEYLTEIGRQIAGLSAFLGGFAATFLGTLLSTRSPRWQAGWAAGCAAIAAASFAVAVICATMLAVILHPSAPARIRESADLGMTRAIAGLAFLLGMYAMLGSLGLSGWIRSRPLGVVTSIAAAAATALATWAAVRL